MIASRWTEGLPRRAHLVGVAGAGMSALARLLRRAGVEVTGSDAIGGSPLTLLRDAGIAAWHGSRPDGITGDETADDGTTEVGAWVVRSAAVADQDREVVACRERGFSSLLYAEALGRLAMQKEALCVAGTHGKTSTTAMVAVALRGGGIDASHVVGGDVPELDGGGHAGASEWLALEACEWNRSFHQLCPSVAAVLNVDHDHFDCYPTENDLIAAFAGFVARVRPGGLVVAASSVPYEIVSARPRGVDLWTVADPGTVGIAKQLDCRAEQLTDKLGCASFVPVVAGHRLPRVQLAVPGRFQAHNALFALALGHRAGADAEGACAALSRFRGVRRRFEIRTGPRGGALVDDYAHHPSEIAAVLATARQRFPGRRLLAVFQPHQHQRTRALLAGFAAELARADLCLVGDIYAAREGGAERAQVAASDLVEAVRERGGQCEAGGDLGQLVERVARARRDDDVILMLGAGDIATVVHDVLVEL